MIDPDESPTKTPPLVAPAHGHGRIYRGGVLGNRGGPGRPPNALRAAMRESLAIRIPIAERIADDENASNSDRLRAIEMLCRYGLSGPDDEHDGEPVTIRVIRTG